MRADFEDSQQSLPHIHSSWGVGNGGGLSCLLNFSTTVVSFLELLIYLSFVGQERVFWYMFMLALKWFAGLGFIQLNHIECLLSAVKIARSGRCSYSC